MKFIAFAASLLAATAAQSADFDINWTVGGGYTLTGAFSFDDALLGTGAIDETDIDFLSFEVFDNGASIGSSSGVAGDGFAGLGGASFNFNFDATTFEFAQSGLLDAPDGQDWNFDGPGVGFGSGTRSQSVSLNMDGGIADSLIPSSDLSLQASVSEVPLPGALGLLLAGLGIVSIFRARSQRA